MPDPVCEEDVQREVLRGETIHQPTRLRGAEVAALRDAASGTRRGGKDDGRTGRRVHIWNGDVPEILTDGEAGRPRGAFDHIEALARAEVAAIVEDAVRRQVHLAVHVHQAAAGPVALRDVQPRVGRTLHESGAHIDAARGVGDRLQAFVVRRARDVAGEILQVVAGERELREHHELCTRALRPADPLLMHRDIPFERTECRGALRDRDADAQTSVRSFSRRSAYSCARLQARASSLASAYTLKSGRSPSGSTSTHSPSFWCFTPSIWRVCSVRGSCARTRITRPLRSHSHGTCSRATFAGGVSSMTSERVLSVTASSSSRRTVANSPS